MIVPALGLAATSPRSSPAFHASAASHRSPLAYRPDKHKPRKQDPRKQEPSYPTVAAGNVSQKSHLQIRTGGKQGVLGSGTRVGVLNGGTILLAPNLTVEAYLDPYPPTTLKAWLDLRLMERTKRHGKTTLVPVKKAVVRVEYDMRYMNHGPFNVTATPGGSGHYVFSLSYIMYGGWDQVVTCTVGGKTYDLDVFVIAYPPTG